MANSNGGENGDLELSSVYVNIWYVRVWGRGHVVVLWLVDGLPLSLVVLYNAQRGCALSKSRKHSDSHSTHHPVCEAYIPPPSVPKPTISPTTPLHPVAWSSCNSSSKSAHADCNPQLQSSLYGFCAAVFHVSEYWSHYCVSKKQLMICLD